MPSDQLHVGGWQLSLGQDNDTVTYGLKNLLPNSNYSIQVMAATEAGNGTAATLCIVTASEPGEGWVS